MSTTLGWTIQDWLKFHANSVPETSLQSLLDVVTFVSSSKDPVWISIANEETITHQWNILQSKSNKEKLPLYGVPVAVKDNIDVREFPTTGACPAYEFTPTEDATVVKLLKSCGAIVIGKTNLDQFATGLVGVRSPYGKPTSVFSEKHVSGGSSSGSAVAVGRGIVPLSLGTDTAGSGRVPAMLNNLIGVKPSRGALSCSGVIPACKSLDVVSIFALNLSDAQYAFNLLAKPDLANDCYSRAMPENPLFKFYSGPNQKIKIAIPANMPWYGESENPKLFSKAISEFKTLENVEISTVDFTKLLDLAKCLYEGPWVAERYAALEKFYESNPDPKSLDATVYKIVQTAKNFDAKDAFNYEYKRQTILQDIKQSLLEKFDVFIVPTAPLNPTLKDLEDEPIKVNSYQGTWTNFVNLADLAALSIPTGFRSDGLPFGVTLLGNTFTDYALLDLAQQYLTKIHPSRFIGGLKHKTVGTGDHLDYSIQQRIAGESSTSIELAVVGAHLKGLPLNWQLDKVNATFVEATTTSKDYKLYALPKTGPVLKPGLRRVEVGGANIEIEIYSVPTSRFGEFISMVPQPLGIGSVETSKGKWVKSFICEEAGYTTKGSVDITSFGSFKKYVQSLESNTSGLLGAKKVSFKKVLIANRGEIAVRITKTLKKLGILSVAIYSDPDKYSKHVETADLAVALKGTTAAETYLDIDKVIAAAKKTGAEAIIPGYGFLSENADFADRCAAEGIVFVGPSGDAIRKLGLKHSAREIAAAANVPLVPGSGLIKDSKEAKEFAETIGYPIMIKSTAGGGGIGLQKVDSPDDIERIFETVQHQGKSYFGDSGVFIERFIESSRHVEVQILADGFGGAIALGERDCSLQRRNQKIIEETPAPNLPQATRERLHAAAENLAKSMKYKSAGTVEFIYDSQRDEFYFLEVNTRLQVEHPITEMVTGFDLVEWMIYIADDAAPNLAEQKKLIKVNGASMEARLYAENPVKNFRPSPGQITEVKFPEFARVDTWVTKGTTISSEYDPTLAKIIVHGKDRADALQKLNKALEETVVHGVVTNVDYLRSIASSELFANVKFHTKILDSYEYDAHAIEILAPGAYTTVQDYPGRTGYWRIGVPPSGPMDNYSFRAANRIVGNHEHAPGIEMTLVGPTIKFHHESVISITGGRVNAKIDGVSVNSHEPITVAKGAVLEVGKLASGCRAYLGIRNGIDVVEYLGSRSTFALGSLGGYNGRTLKFGDVLFLGQPQLSANSLPGPVAKPTALPKALIPDLETKTWEIGVTCGPHGAPDIFKPEFVETFFSDEWKIHYNSNRFGVRLVGPKPKWARLDGGEGGLHPSNAHDYVYSMGAINFTGDEPVILTCDGPSLGGFVCHAVVAEAEMWKVGQVKPGDSVKFIPITYDSARELKVKQDESLENFAGQFPLALADYKTAPEDPVLYKLEQSSKNPKVVYRQAGDRYILVEYGNDNMDLNLSYRVNRLITMVENHKTVGIVEMSQGVRSVLIEYDGSKIHQKKLLEILLAYEKEILFVNKWSVKSKVVKLPMAFEDKQTLAAVKRYQETIRASAPWLPNNVDFVAKINGMTKQDVRDLMYAARFLVLGLGDVFLGAPCAIPLQGELTARRYPLPLLGSKYNPSRTFTPNGTVGLGGMYMCIYTMESPGGYQLIGRTIPIWDKLSLGSHSTGADGKEQPWLLTPFDQIEFYPVSEEELEVLTEQTNNGKFKIDIEDSVFDHKEYMEWIQEHSTEIEKVRESKKIGEKLEEFKTLIQISNQELMESSAPRIVEEEAYPEDAEMVYSQYSGRFWKPLVAVGDTVEKGQGMVVVEAMKTEMTVTAPKSGKVLKIIHQNGDMVDAGDLVVVIH
ncbi:bifunctional urea carboxylase/allophanate hydrolase [Saccharomycopsis crataegensis]|uniref:Urea amidolyase n=1 Tax=Saccharomycopsis crataegensis TaxID=43959 RepID=A0AAV5QMU1_9ASCO|nr:bifunctional urea carboxylase/allophanate hydrolase [Saccharomycopsis crataegensis]